MDPPILREETREAILDSGELLFQQFGYKKTTVEEIAQQAKVSRATVYLYFRCKEEIALAWLDRHNRRLCDRLAEISRQTVTSVERLQSMLFLRVLYKFDACQPFRQSRDELLAALRQPLLDQRERHHEQEAQLLATVVTEGQADGTFMPGDALQRARLLIVATNSLLPYSLSTRQLGERAEIDAKVRGISRLLLEGLLRRESSPHSSEDSSSTVGVQGGEPQP